MQPYELIRSGRRTLALELRGGRVIVRAPYRISQAAIDRFVASHADWIARGLVKQEARAAVHPEPTDAEREAYIRQAKACLPLPDAGAHHGRAHALWQLQLAGAHLLFMAADAVPAGGDRLRRRARAGAPALHEPRRGVLRAHRALSAGLEGPPRPAAGMKSAPEDAASSGAPCFRAEA